MTGRPHDEAPEHELMARVAFSYYTEGLTQQEIAERVGTSRPTVSRLLRKAVDQGVVQITVHVPPWIDVEFETELARTVGLDSVIAVRDHDNPDVQRGEVARAAADFLRHRLAGGSVVAVGMGRNVSAVADHAASSWPRGCVYVSAIGGSSRLQESLSSNDICRRFAEATDGRSEGLYTPAYVEDRATRDALLAHADIAQPLARAHSADAAVVGIGDAEQDSLVVRMGCFSAADMRENIALGAVGDVLGSFFDIRGRPVRASVGDKVVGLSATTLRAMPGVIAVVCEPEKVRAVVGAMSSGIINTLVAPNRLLREVSDLVASETRHPA